MTVLPLVAPPLQHVTSMNLRRHGGLGLGDAVLCRVCRLRGRPNNAFVRATGGVVAVIFSDFTAALAKRRALGGSAGTAHFNDSAPLGGGGECRECLYSTYFVHCSERRLWHVTEELSSLTFALHFCFVLNSAGRAHASVSHSGGGLLGAADTQTAHPATFSTAPAHQPLGSANAETTPAGAQNAAADRTQRPDATCEGKNVAPPPPPEAPSTGASGQG